MCDQVLSIAHDRLRKRRTRSGGRPSRPVKSWIVADRSPDSPSRGRARPARSRPPRCRGPCCHGCSEPRRLLHNVPPIAIGSRDLLARRQHGRPMLVMIDVTLVLHRAVKSRRLDPDETGCPTRRQALCAGLCGCPLPGADDLDGRRRRPHAGERRRRAARGRRVEGDREKGTTASSTVARHSVSGGCGIRCVARNGRTPGWKKTQKKLRERLQARGDNVLEIARKGEQLTFKQWAELFLENHSKPPLRTVKTHEANARAVKHLVKAFGDQKLADMSSDAIEGYLRYRLRQRRRSKRRGG
jgi:hypothetical protein